jgi:hypothetical protein
MKANPSETGLRPDGDDPYAVKGSNVFGSGQAAPNIEKTTALCAGTLENILGNLKFTERNFIPVKGIF